MPFISVVIPNYNGEKTIGRCLAAMSSSNHNKFEVIVVDDCSEDGSVDIIKQFPCKLIRLTEHSGASRARNEGAQAAKGDAIFFTDSDCVLEKDTLSIASASFREDAVIGGTYTLIPYDKGFFGRFQSVFINYSETKGEAPDYVATHAMLISRRLFEKSGGFSVDFMPILEDVEFSHRLKKDGIRLVMNPALRVRHIFGFTLRGSLKNAFRKSAYWTAYSIKNRDLMKDSGTASIELKVNSVLWLLSIFLASVFALTGSTVALYAIAALFIANVLLHVYFIGLLARASGAVFALAAWLYYSLLYPSAVIAGGLSGALMALGNNKLKK